MKYSIYTCFERIKSCKMPVATIFVYTFYAYLMIGLLFAAWFILKGVDKIDENMHGTNWKLRILLLPGSVLLWPFLLNKYRSKL